MAKTVVSAVKPGRQAFWSCPPGFLVCAAARQLGPSLLYIDNGGCSLEAAAIRTQPRAPWRGSQRVSLSGKALCQITFPGLVLRNAVVRLPNPLKIALLCSGTLQVQLPGRPSGNAL